MLSWRGLGGYPYFRSNAQCCWSWSCPFLRLLLLLLPSRQSASSHSPSPLGPPSLVLQGAPGVPCPHVTTGLQPAEAVVPVPCLCLEFLPHQPSLALSSVNLRFPILHSCSFYIFAGAEILIKSRLVFSQLPPPSMSCHHEIQELRVGEALLWERKGLVQAWMSPQVAWRNLWGWRPMEAMRAARLL